MKWCSEQTSSPTHVVGPPDRSTSREKVSVGELIGCAPTRFRETPDFCLRATRALDGHEVSSGYERSINIKTPVRVNLDAVSLPIHHRLFVVDAEQVTQPPQAFLLSNLMRNQSFEPDF